MITLVLGGARSGKSSVAERLAGEAGGEVLYVATSVVTDQDMAERIAEHVERRPAHWRTVEAGRSDLPGLLAREGGIALVDSLGAWVASLPEMELDSTALIDALVSRSGDTVLVSDEVGLSVHPSSESGRRFRDALGRLNAEVADVADRVLLVVAGRVLELPDRW